MPTLALTNTIAFRQMSDPKLQFGSIRVLGTAGWIAAGLTIGATHLEATRSPMRLAAGLSFVFAIYSFFLPATPPLAKAKTFSVRDILPPEVLALFKTRSAMIFALASFLICIPLQFYYAFTNLFLNQDGVNNAAGKMTAGSYPSLF